MCSFRIAELLLSFTDFAVKGGELGILPKIFAVRNVIILPGLFVKCVMHNTCFALAGKRRGLCPICPMREKITEGIDFLYAV